MSGSWQELARTFLIASLAGGGHARRRSALKAHNPANAHNYFFTTVPRDLEVAGRSHSGLVTCTLALCGPELWFLLGYIVAKHEAYFTHSPKLVVIQARGAEDGAFRVAAGVHPG